MHIILFIYGLSFFTLSIAIFAANTKQSRFFFANKIWLLGLFGLTHAVVEWITLYYYIFPHTKTFLIPYELLLLLLSYLFLFEFSRFTLRYIFEKQSKKTKFIYDFYAPAVIYPLSFSLLLGLIIIDPQLNETIVAIRYTFGFWGSLFLGVGLYAYAFTLKHLHHTNNLRYYFKIGGIAFIFYAFFGGIIVPYVDHFPANYINTTWFQETFQAPVQLFRSFCAGIIALVSIKALQIFQYEMVEQVTESSNQIKEFSSNASHQLKTPLASMQLQIDVTLKKERPIEEYKKVLSSIRTEIETLKKLVITLLMLARVRDFGEKSSFKPIEIGSIILEILGEYVPIAKAKEVSLHIEHLDTTAFHGNKDLICILITNLLDNAIKHTPKGKEVSLSLTSKCLKISDEGEGIPEEKQKFIFDKYYQLSKKSNHTTSSFGLGLALAKKIAILHNIKITFQNNKDIGTTFSVYF